MPPPVEPITAQSDFLANGVIFGGKVTPTAEVMMLLDEHLPKDQIAEAVSLNASHIGFHYQTLTSALVQTSHNIGLKVFTYTVNEPHDMQQVRGLGVDGIISDFPDRI
jgi:glycerophosphoryl diester phosphodiesterase